MSHGIDHVANGFSVNSHGASLPQVMPCCMKEATFSNLRAGKNVFIQLIYKMLKLKKLLIAMLPTGQRLCRESNCLVVF